MDGLVDKLIRDRLNLESTLKQALVQVSLEAVEACAKDHDLDKKHLREKYVDPIVQAYCKREFLPPQIMRVSLCHGKYHSGAPCHNKALANGFCKVHADQYEAWNAKRKAELEFLERRAKNPQHTHGPCRGLVEGCPMCDILRKKNPFLSGERAMPGR